MSDAPQGPGWWQASDGRWYPPQPTPPPAPAPTPPPYGAVPTPPPGTPLGTPAPPSYGPTTAPPASYGPPTSPPPPPGFAGGPVPPAGKKGNAGLYAVLAVIAFVAIAGTALFFVVSGGDDGGDGPDPTRPDDTAAGTLRLLPVDEAGPDPFSPTSFVSDGLPDISSAASDAAQATRDGLDDDQSGAVVAVGSLAGLYGGSRSDQICDAVSVADFLEGDADAGPAFAGVLGITADASRDYLVGLTPVVLVSDTWVTGHGRDGARATAYQAVLQAGTAVLVDDRGVPRVRCADGGPLTAPTRQDRSTEATEGAEWDGYDPGAVVVVEAGDALTTLTLVDVESGEEFDRAVGAGQTGDVQVTLQWSTGADLDLHVFDPDGTEVYFNSDDDPSGGTLDIDVIPSCDDGDETHTENVFWPEGAAPSGTYRIEVVNYTACEGAAVDFTVQAVVGGEVVLDESATVAADETSDFTFDR